MSKKELEETSIQFKSEPIDVSSFGEVLSEEESNFLIGQRVTWKSGNERLPMIMRGLFIESYSKGLTKVRVTSFNSKPATLITVVNTAGLQLIPDDDTGPKDLYIQY